MSGVVAGAIIQHAIELQSDYHKGRSATTNAIGGVDLTECTRVDIASYLWIIAKFGMIGIIDKCMTSRGYKILFEMALAVDE